jgi:hypothetical protein
MSGLGVNGCLELWVSFSWVLHRNKFAFVVEGLDIVLFVRQEQVRAVEGFQEGHGTVQWAVFMLVL